jgi:hypothetical protein
MPNGIDANTKTIGGSQERDQNIEFAENEERELTSCIC